MTNLRALTIQQPWAWAIAAGEKTVENRRWQTHYRGPIVIHAGVGVGTRRHHDETVSRVAELSGYTVETVRRLSELRGHIIAVARLDDVCGESLYRGRMSPLLCDCGLWAMSQDRHFKLTNVRRLTTPIPAKGALNLWRVSDDAQAQIAGQIDLRSAA